MTFYLFYFVLGHILAAFAIYLNHRFVFHGKLGKLPFFKFTKRLHALHHAHAYTEDRNDYFEPLWLKIVFLALLFVVGLVINASFALGLTSFIALYAFRHERIHNDDKTSRFSLHHRHHHTVNVKCNYSGVYPIIDYIFGTAASQKVR